MTMTEQQITGSSSCSSSRPWHILPLPAMYTVSTARQHISYHSRCTSSSTSSNSIHQDVHQLSMQPSKAVRQVHLLQFSPLRHSCAGTFLFIPSVTEPAAASFTSPALASTSDINSSSPSTSSPGSSIGSSNAHRPSSSTTSSSSSSSSSSTSQASSGQHAHEQRSLKEVLHKAGVRALGGGLPGAAAMIVQVVSLMWLRTTVNYQYRYGTSTRVALRTLYADGGVARFYQGVGPALLQGPLCRFGDTAANAGMLSVLAEYETTRALPLGLQTAAASAAAATWRMLLLPLDAAKTMMQVEGKHGLQHLWQKVRAGGPGVLYHGAAASVAASFVGHYPWFTTYNTLNSLIPLPDTLHGRLLRSAGIGFCAGVVSDAVSNSVRVVKTSRQTARHSTSYTDVIKSIVAKDGVSGLFTRGLTTRIAANGLQNICFTVLWNLGQERLKGSQLMASLNGHSSK